MQTTDTASMTVLNHGIARFVPGRRWIPYAAVGCIAIVWGYVAATYWIFTTTAALILAIAALGLTVVVGWAREVSLAQAALVGTAVYLSGYAYRPAGGWGWPFLLAAGFGIAVSVALSVLVALATARLSGIYIMILTLGLQMTIERTIFADLKLTGGGAGLATPRPEALGVSLASDRAFYFFTLFVLAGGLLLLARLRASRYGRSLLLVGTDRQAAASVGVSPWRYKIFAFALAGFFAGVAGTLTAPSFGAPPSPLTYSALSSLFYLAIPVLAGFHSLLAVVLVAVVFGLAPQALEPFHISPLLLGSAGLYLGTLAGRSGVSGLINDLVAKWRQRRPGQTDGSDTRSPRPPASGEIDLRSDDGIDQGGSLAVLESYLPPPPDPGIAMSVEDVSVTFGGLRALDSVSLTVPSRHLVGLIGPNGAGKSTLFDIINGLRQPDQGEVTLFGREITATTAWDRAKLGMSRTFQSNRLSLELSVIENLLAGAYHMIPGNPLGALVGRPVERDGERRATQVAHAVADLLDLTPVAHQAVGDLDFGAQRRVEIGRSLMSGPRLLLLDEPAAGLDAHEASRLFALIRRLEADLGLTVLLVEHYVRAVLENCDLVYVLDQGRLIASGRPEEVAANPDVRAAYLGGAGTLKGNVDVDA